MKLLPEEIDANIPQLEVNVILINDVDASQERVFSEIDKTFAGKDDIIWYYYSGFGQNYDGWPISTEGQLPLTKVHKKLKTTDARLTLAMYDC